jgi:hypothetical protein
MIKSLGIGIFLRKKSGLKIWADILDHLAATALSSSEDVVWDLGCGWGGDGLALAKKYQCKVLFIDSQDTSTSIIASTNSDRFKFEKVELNEFFSSDNFAFVRKKLPPTIIIAKDILEHLSVSEGLHVLAECRKNLLVSGGAVIASVPNSSSPFGLRNFCNDLTHKTPFGERSLSALFSQAGYSSISCIPLDEIYPGRVGFLLNLFFHFATKRVVSLLLAPCIGWGRHSFWSPNLCIIARP